MLKAILARFRKTKPQSATSLPIAETTLPKLIPVKEHFFSVAANSLHAPKKENCGKYILLHADDHPMWDDDDERIILRTGFRLILPPGWAAVTAIHRGLHSFYLGYYNSELLTCSDTDELCIRVSPLIGCDDAYRIPPRGTPLCSIWIMPAPERLDYTQMLEYQMTIETWQQHWKDASESHFRTSFN